MSNAGRRNNILFYILLGSYVLVGAVLDIFCFEKVWRVIVPWVQIFIGVVGFGAAFFLLKTRTRVQKGTAERPILLFVALSALFLGIAGMSMGVIEFFTGDEAFTHSALSIANIISPIAFLFTAIFGVAAIIFLIRSSYAIVSPRQLLILSAVSVVIFVVFGVVFLTPITGIKLDGVMKIAAIFFSVVCVCVLASTAFVLMAFGRGKERRYWRSMVFGLMIIALSGLVVFICYATGGQWVGLALLGFTAAEAFLAFAGYQRWQKLKH